jgi:hypothetical protein
MQDFSGESKARRTSQFGEPEFYYDGDVRYYDYSEMVAPQWSDLGAVIQSVEAQQDNLFPPFADSIRVLNDVLQAEGEKISQEELPNFEKSPIIPMEDGTPGSGRYPKGSGEDLEKELLRQKLKDTLVGQKMADGEEIKFISLHAAMRFDQRHIKPEKALDTLQNPYKTKPGNEGKGS